MAKFYLGQRIKKVRGGNIGSTARISRFAAPDHEGYDMWVRLEGEAEGRLMRLPAGFEARTISGQWEPITPPHVAGSWEVIEQLLPNIREGVCA